MSELIREEEYETTEGFTVDSDAKAMWVLEKIRKARADRDELIEWYNKQIEKINQQTDFNTLLLERMLAEYFKTVPHKKTKTQESYSLPGAKLVLKKQNPEYKHDDKTVIAWLEKNNGQQYIKTKKELDWSGLKSAGDVVEGKLVIGETITEDGEIIQITVPGVEVIDREEKFVVEV